MYSHRSTSVGKLLQPFEGYQGFSLTPSGSIYFRGNLLLNPSRRKLIRNYHFVCLVSGPVWKNIYHLSDKQISDLDSAEELMQLMEINAAEKILLDMLAEDSQCVPVLNNLGHMYGRYLSDFEKAVEYYDTVLQIEPDNAWARDERRRYRRYITYD